MRTLLDAYDERLMVGEIYLPNNELIAYYGTRLDECHLPFNFQLINARWEPDIVRCLVDQYETDLPSGAWPNWVLGNHDQRRLATRVGCEQARVAIMLLLTLRGTPTWYYGDELGMEDVPIPRESMKDPQALNQPAIADRMSRDPGADADAMGFRAECRLRAAGRRNLAACGGRLRDSQCRSAVARSAVHARLFRALTTLRQRIPALMVGDYASVETASPDVFAYTRTLSKERYLVVLNFGADRRRLGFGGLDHRAEILLSTRMDRGGELSLHDVTVEPNEGLLVRLS